jgi:hypothetical protein
MLDKINIVVIDKRIDTDNGCAFSWNKRRHVDEITAELESSRMKCKNETWKRLERGLLRLLDV